MLGIVGTVPDLTLPLLYGDVRLRGDTILVAEKTIPVRRGTPALLAAAARTLEALDRGRPFGFLAGDIGLGEGSRRLYEYLCHHLDRYDLETLTFHYLQPDVDWHNRVLFSVEALARRPILIADAGFMYAAKMSGQAGAYDLFTPDAGELAFLADEEAPHPFYTRGFVLHEENRVPELAARAFEHDNASRVLLVKGRRDYVVDQKRVIATIEAPAEEALEPIGGTGDALTGIVSALVQAGFEVADAAAKAAQVNRLAGFWSKPTPVTQVAEWIAHISRALEEVLQNHGKVPKEKRGGSHPSRHDRPGRGLPLQAD
jgi:hypothetical protein